VDGRVAAPLVIPRRDEVASPESIPQRSLGPDGFRARQGARRGM